MDTTYPGGICAAIALFSHKKGEAMLYFAALVLLIVSAFSGVFMAVKFMEERQRRWLAALAGCIVVLLISGFILVFGEWAISKENAQVALVTCLFLAVVIISVAFGPHEKEET